MEPKALGSYLGISKQSEVLILSTVGIFCTIFDASLLNLWPDLYLIWNVLMDPVMMPIIMHLYIRYILSGVVIAKALTLHIYLASYVVLMYPACTMERPQLILPWLLIGSVKTIALCTLTFSTGMYVCIMYRFMRPACWDFLFTQFVTHGPSFYMWALILSYYRDLRKIEKIANDIEVKSLCTVDISKRRKRAKSLMQSAYDSSLYDYEDNRPFISASTIENMVHHLGWAGKKNMIVSRSLDTLVSEIEMEVDRQLLLGVEIEESFVTNDNMTIEEKTAHLLKVSPMEIVRAKRERKITRQIASTSKMTALSSLAMPSLMDIKQIRRALSTNLLIKQGETSTVVSDTKSYIFGSEREIRVVELDSSECLIRTVTQTETTELVIQPLRTKMTKKIEIVFSGSSGTSAKRLMKYARPAKTNVSYSSLRSNSTKSLHKIEPTTLPVDKTEVHQVHRRNSYKYDGYTEAYLRKKKYEEETARNFRMRNLK